MNELLAQFVTEARELLEQAGADLLAMERNTGDADTVNRLFRGIHTLKGSSGLFDVAPLTRVLHAAEDVFQAVRESKLTLTPELVDLALNVLDQVGRWVEHLDTHDTLPAEAMPIAVTLQDALRAMLGETPAAGQVATAAADAADSELPYELAEQFGEARLMAAVSAAAAEKSVALITYTPEGGCLFKGEDPLHLMLQVPGLQALITVPRAHLPPADEIDPYTCILAFHAVAFAPIDALNTLFRYVPDQVVICELTPDALIVPTGNDGPKLPNEALRTLLRLRRVSDSADRLDVLQDLADGVPANSLAASCVRWLGHLLDDQAFPARWATALIASLQGPAADNATGPSSAALEVVGTLLRQQIALLNLDVPADELVGRILSAGRVVANALRHARDLDGAAVIDQARGEAAEAALPAALLTAFAALAEKLKAPPPSSSRAADGAPAGATEDGAERPASRTLRVDQEKIDALMNLVGELIVAKNSLPFLARRAEQQFGVRELAREIKDQYGVIDRIAQELQTAIMGVRMMPVGQVFQRFPRLVRDISRKLGKQVELVIEGEATEADKNVIENLFDPLLHMVRNSLDHGIEPPEDRAAKGKPAAATIRLAARQDSDQVLIAVADDGRGIDPEVIKHKAFERGLIDSNRLATITDDEARLLIFAAGFSTAERISDLSGRGVGMDVVRSAVEKAGGRISVTSELGRGTTVELSVPLSMAVTRIMTVTIGDRLFGIPMDAIAETVKLKRAQIVAIKDRSAFVLRNRIVPLVGLADLLDLPDAPAFGDEVAVLVVRVGVHTLGLAISAFGEGMEVILKPLDGILTGISGYAGTSLLGDGRVLLVLNLAELVP